MPRNLTETATCPSGSDRPSESRALHKAFMRPVLATITCLILPFRKPPAHFQPVKLGIERVSGDLNNEIFRLTLPYGGDDKTIQYGLLRAFDVFVFRAVSNVDVPKTDSGVLSCETDYGCWLFVIPSSFVSYWRRSCPCRQRPTLHRFDCGHGDRSLGRGRSGSACGRDRRGQRVRFPGDH